MCLLQTKQLFIGRFKRLYFGYKRTLPDSHELVFCF